MELECSARDKKPKTKPNYFKASIFTEFSFHKQCHLLSKETFKMSLATIGSQGWGEGDPPPGGTRPWSPSTSGTPQGQPSPEPTHASPTDPQTGGERQQETPPRKEASYIPSKRLPLVLYEANLKTTSYE